MNTEKVLTNGVRMIKEGKTQKGRPWKLYALIDEYDEIWGTWLNDRDIYQKIDAAAGNEIEVEYEQDGDFRKIKGVVGDSPNGGGQPKPDETPFSKPGEPLTKNPNPTTVVGVGTLAETAWLCAAQMAKSDLGWDAAKHLADRILTDLMIKHGVDPTDYPF